MAFSDSIGAIDDAVFNHLSDTAATYIPAGAVASWSPTKTSTDYICCTLIIDRATVARVEGFDYQPPGHEVTIQVRKSEITTPESGAQFYVASGTFAGRWQIVERENFDGTVYTLGVRSV